MLAIVKSVALLGMEGHLIRVEVDVSNGLPALNIVGLPDNAVREAAERVRTAVKNSGFEFPIKRITVNLAPADLKKEGPVFDLAIAIGILAASGQIVTDRIGEFIFIGELSLDGSIKYVQGILPSVLLAKEKGEKNIIISHDNGPEGALVREVNIFALRDLQAAVKCACGHIGMAPVEFATNCTPDRNGSVLVDLGDVKGQLTAKRALEISAAGGHNMIMIGPPGSGKTMLAQRLPDLLPDLSWQEAIEITKIYSVAGLLKRDSPLINQRPFRAPHHNVSRQGLIGGGRIPRPGEITLSNHGVLFLDEIPEFSKDSLEALRQPLEDRLITISRVNAALTYPAKMLLVAAMNPCPCGYFGSTMKECQCSPVQIKRYINRLSGPLIDRIDLHVEVPALKYNDMVCKEPGEPTSQVRGRVVKARDIQKARLGFEKACNAEMSSREVKEYCHLGRASSNLLKEAFRQLGLSARAHNRILKISRTIADLEGSNNIREEHVAEAIQYRSLDRKFWA